MPARDVYLEDTKVDAVIGASVQVGPAYNPVAPACLAARVTGWRYPVGQAILAGVRAVNIDAVTRSARRLR